MGHAGVLIVNGGPGLATYFEYCRHDKAGLGLDYSPATGRLTIEQ